MSAVTPTPVATAAPQVVTPAAATNGAAANGNGAPAANGANGTTNGAAAASTAPATKRTLPRRKEPIPEDTPISEDEKEYMKEFRAKMAGKADNLSDMTILRFVRGFCCSEQPEDKALEMLGKMTDWRIKEKVDEVAKMKISYRPDFAETWHSGIHGLDKLGHPIFIDRPGACDPAVLTKKGYDISKIMLVHIQHMERLIATEEAVSKARGLNRYKHIAIIDLSGLGMKHLGKEFYGPMKTIIDIDQYYYPDTLYRLFVVNAPFIFRALWAIVSPMVDPTTKTKIQFGTDNLEKYIDKHTLPRFLGGTCKCAEGKCLRVPFVSGNDETLPVVDIGNGPKDEKGNIVDAGANTTNTAADGTAAAPASASAAALPTPSAPSATDAKSAPAATATAAAPAATTAAASTTEGSTAAAATTTVATATATQAGAKTTVAAARDTMSRQPPPRTRKPPVPRVRKVVAVRNTNAVSVEPELTHEFNIGGSYSELSDRLHANARVMQRLSAQSTRALDASTRAFHTYLNTVHPSAGGSPYVNWPHASLSVNSALGGGGPPRPAWAPYSVAPNPLSNVPQSFNPNATATATAAATAAAPASTDSANESSSAAAAAVTSLPVWGGVEPAGDAVSALAAEQIRLSERFHQLNAQYHTAMRSPPPKPAAAYARTPAVTAAGGEAVRGRTDPTDDSVQVVTTASATATNSTAAAASVPASTAAAAATAGAIVAPNNSAASVKVTPIIASYVSSPAAVAAAAAAATASADASAAASSAGVVIDPASTSSGGDVPHVTRHVRKLNRRVDHYVDDLVQSLAYRMTIAPPAF